MKTYTVTTKNDWTFEVNADNLKQAKDRAALNVRIENQYTTGKKDSVVSVRLNRTPQD